RTRSLRADEVRAADGFILGSVATLAGPRGEDEQDPGAALARDRVAFGRIEAEEHSDARVDRLAAAVDAGATLDDGHPRALLHLVLAQLLTGRDREHHGTRPVGGLQHDRVARACRRVE